MLGVCGNVEEEELLRTYIHTFIQSVCSSLVVGGHGG